MSRDIVELKDELDVAKIAHGYRPCITEQAQPVINIAQAEDDKISKIVEYACRGIGKGVRCRSKFNPPEAPSGV